MGWPLLCCSATLAVCYYSRGCYNSRGSYNRRVLHQQGATEDALKWPDETSALPDFSPLCRASSVPFPPTFLMNLLYLEYFLEDFCYVKAFRGRNISTARLFPQCRASSVPPIQHSRGWRIMFIKHQNEYQQSTVGEHHQLDTFPEQQCSNSIRLSCRVCAATSN